MKLWQKRRDREAGNPEKSNDDINQRERERALDGSCTG